jgi:hypothetical protein
MAALTTMVAADARLLRLVASADESRTRAALRLVPSISLSRCYDVWY